MKAIIKKVKGVWQVNVDGTQGIYDDHDKAVKAAYEYGATEFEIKYSANIGRSFDRTGIENFVLKVS